MTYQSTAQMLTDKGLAACFGIPGGGTSLQLITSLENEGIPFYLTHFEGSAAIMAATTGRLSNAPGLSLSIKGPGLANALPGLAVAWFEAFPLVHVAEAAPANAPPWSLHKRLDQSKLCQTVVKATGCLSPQNEGMHEAYAVAAAEEPGPVLLEMTDGAPVAPDIPAPCSFFGQPVSGLKEKVRICRKPVIIAGAYALRLDIGELFSELPFPVFTSVAAKGIIDETCAQYAGVFTGVDESLTPERNIVPESDLVISIGLSAREMLAVKPFSCPSIHFGDYMTSGLEGFKFDWILPTTKIAEILSELKERTWGINRISKVKHTLIQKLTEYFLPGSVYSAIERAFGQNARMVLDTGSFCTVGEYLCRPRHYNMFLAAGQSRYMGTCLPMALGAAIFDTSVPTIAVTGDGGVGMYIADIKLAVQHKLPLLYILMSDGGFGCMREKAMQNKLSVAAITTDGKTWVECLNGLGVPGERIESEQHLERSLNRWHPESGPAFLEIVFNPERYQKMTEGVRA